MKKSSIIANIEGILEPVPKAKRTMLRINAIFQQRYASLKKDKTDEWEELCAGKGAANIETAREIVDALNRRENIEVATELRRYFSGLTIGKEAMQPVKNSGLVRMLWAAREHMEGFLGCSASEAGIRFKPDISSSYSPEKAEICIVGIPFSSDRNRILFDIYHEYSHHLEFCTQIPEVWMRQVIIAEGFADCAGMSGAAYGAANIENRIRHMVHRRLEDFREFYAESRFESYTSFRSISYIIGTASFLIAEAKHGKKIYREIIKSPEPAEYLLKKLK